MLQLPYDGFLGFGLTLLLTSAAVYSWPTLPMGRLTWQPKTQTLYNRSSRRPDIYGCRGKLLSPAHRRACVEHVRKMFQVSERFACRVLASIDSNSGRRHTGGLMKRR